MAKKQNSLKYAFLISLYFISKKWAYNINLSLILVLIAQLIDSLLLCREFDFYLRTFLQL